jgi:hypothetical protein
MNRGYWTPERTAGGLLVASLLVLPVAVIVLIATGGIRVFGATLQGSLADMAPYAAAFRLLSYGYAVAWIVQLLGVALLARLLARTGRERMAVVIFTLVLVAALLGVLHGAYAARVITWAALEAAQMGSLPAGYEAVDILISGAFGVGYIAHLVAAAGLGWAVIGWSALWLAARLAGAGAPAVLFITPAVIGAALVWSRAGPSPALNS